MSSGAPITIRKAVPSDATQIHSVLAVAFTDYYTMLGITPPAISETIEDIKIRYRGKKRHSRARKQHADSRHSALSYDRRYLLCVALWDTPQLAVGRHG